MQFELFGFLRDGRELELGYIVQLRLELRVAFAGPAYLGGLAVSYVEHFLRCD